MIINRNITVFEIIIFFLFLICEFLYIFNSLFIVYGSYNYITSYGIVWMLSLCYNVYIFLKYTRFDLFDPIFKNIIWIVIIYFAYISFFDLSIFSILWFRVLYVITFINLYSLLKNNVVYNILKKIVFVLWSVLIMLFLFIRIQGGNDIRITLPTYIILLMSSLFIKKDEQNINWINLLLLFIIILLSTKRGALISFIVSIIVSLLIDGIFVKKKKNYIFKYITYFSFVIICFFVIMSNYNVDIFGRLKTINEDRGSGRVDVAVAVWEAIKYSSIYEKKWGHGFNSVVNNNVYYSISAHNDFLEIIYDYGYVGLLIFIFLNIKLILFIIKCLKDKSYMSFQFIFQYLCFLMLSNFSHVMLYTSCYYCFFISYMFLLSEEFHRNNNLSKNIVYTSNIRN